MRKVFFFSHEYRIVLFNSKAAPRADSHPHSTSLRAKMKMKVKFEKAAKEKKTITKGYKKMLGPSDLGRDRKFSNLCVELRIHFHGLLASPQPTSVPFKIEISFSTLTFWERASASVYPPFATAREPKLIQFACLCEKGFCSKREYFIADCRKKGGD